MPRRRLASRILLISPSNRLLLFKIHYRTGALAGMSYWATPGGKVGAGESHEEAAIRELHEETGIRVQSVGQCVACLEFPWLMPDGEWVLAVEQYFVVRACDESCSCSRWSDHERAVMYETRWWSEDELMVCQERVYPQDLPGLFVQNLSQLHPKGQGESTA